ncbi:hypothetical protein ACQJBY_009462 [Aegilops geniculata]
MKLLSPAATTTRGSCRRPAHISTSSGHRRAPNSPGSHTATYLVLVGLHNRTTPGRSTPPPSLFIVETPRIPLPPCCSHGVRWSTSSLSCCTEAQLLHCGGYSRR